MPTKNPVPTVQVDPLDLENKSNEERIQMAIKAIERNGFNEKGNPELSFREAASIFQVSKTTLTARFKGRKTRVEAHEKERKLSPACEEALIDWAKEKGRRNIPLHPSAVAEHASIISGTEIGEAWVRKFRARHPEIKAKWTTGLEQCRANGFNETVVKEFYDEFEDIKVKYNIKDHNMYNMDEKGVQLGVGGRVKALIDRNQKDAQVIEDGNRELVTIIECVCADGTAIPPSVVFQGKRRDLEWGRDNPCNARYAPKGWTDQELGSKWLERDFEPSTRARCEPDEYRLLILDGHNSHTTYRFCSFAEKHKIIVLCLPPHTTHRLQPCDVGVFGPLAATWKAEVTRLSTEMVPIRKTNFIRTYSRAREKAFSQETIKSAFKRTGLAPFNRNTIPLSAYAPALNTTTKAAQPISAELPDILTPIPTRESTPMTSPPTSPTATHAPPTSATSTGSTVGSDLLEELTDAQWFARMTAEQMYEFVGLPARSLRRADREELRKENLKLRNMLDRACFQMQCDYALKKLMDRENERLRQRLFNKENRKMKKKTATQGRHMTSEENLHALALEDWKSAMKEIFASSEFKAQRKKLQDEERAKIDQEKERQRVKKKAEQEERIEKRAQEQKERQDLRAREKEEKKKEKAFQALMKAAEKDEKARRSAEKREEAAARREQQAALRAARKGGKKAGTKRRQARQVEEGIETEVDEPEAGTIEKSSSHPPQQGEPAVPEPPAAPPPRPRRQTRPKPQETSRQLMEEMGPVRRSSKRQIVS